MLLVELRKEFRMRGLDAQKLPETFNSPEVLLGTGSPLESVDLYAPVDERGDLTMATMMWASKWRNMHFLVDKHPQLR